MKAIEAQLASAEETQISLTDPDARSMQGTGKATGTVGYNVQCAVETENHLIVAHEVTNAVHEKYRYTNEENGKVLRNYWATACSACPLKDECTTGKERRVKRWEHEAVLEAAQDRLDRRPDAMTERRSTAEHPFGTLKFWMGSAHFLMKRLGNVRTEMSLHVLSYNMKRVMNILGVPGSLQAMRA